MGVLSAASEEIEYTGGGNSDRVGRIFLLFLSSLYFLCQIQKLSFFLWDCYGLADRLVGYPLHSYIELGGERVT